MSSESYQHKLAKNLLASWFVADINLLYKPPYHDRVQSFEGLSVYDGVVIEAALEFPVFKTDLKKGYVSDNDFTCHENDIGLTNFGYRDFGDIYNTSKIKPTLIFDLALIFDGRVKYAFEIYHKHSVSSMKAAMINYLQLTCFEISSDWLLSQVNRPKKLQFKNVYGRGRNSFLK
jgi:hypothetical protein